MEELQFLMVSIIRAMSPRHHVAFLIERTVNENSIYIFSHPKGGSIESQLPNKKKIGTS